MSPKSMTLIATVAISVAAILAANPGSEEQASDASSVEIPKSSIPAKEPSMPTRTPSLTGGILTIGEAGEYELSGDDTKGVLVNTAGDVRLVLNGVRIKSDTGAAIHVERADNVIIELAAGSENYLEDAATRADSSIDGVVFSSADLALEGTGRLTVKANHADGIVSMDDLIARGGEYVVTSADDGIRGRDSFIMEGGTISIVAAGDGIKSTNDRDPGRGFIHVTNGSITIDAGDDGIKAVNRIVVDGGEIKVKRSREGIEAANVILNDGDITVVAMDDGINAVESATNDSLFIQVTGGNIDVTVGAGDTDAFDSNGSVSISGGMINITAPTSAIDYETEAEMTGGTLVVNGQTLDEIPPPRFGRRGGWRR